MKQLGHYLFKYIIHKMINFFYFKELHPLERNIRLMYLYNLFVKMMISLPIEAIFFAQITGNYTQAMSVYAIVYSIGVLTSLPLGVLADKVGRKKVSVLAAGARFSSVVVYAFSDSYGMLLIGSIFAGLYRGVGSGNNAALLYESLDKLNQKEKYHDVMSVMSAFGMFGLGAGSLLCGVFAWFSLQAAMYATIIPMSILLIVSLFLTEPTVNRPPLENPYKHLWSALKYLKREKRLSCFILADSAHFALNESAFSFNGNFYKTIIPEWSLGAFRFVGNMCNGFTNCFSAKVAQKIGLKKTILTGAMTDDIVNILASIFANPISLIFKTAGSSANGIYSPASCVYLQQLVSEKERGTLLSISALVICLFYSIGTMFVGWIADLTNPAIALLSGYSLALVADFLYFWAFRQKPILDVLPQTVVGSEQVSV